MELGYEMFCYQCEQTANGKGCYPSGRVRIATALADAFDTDVNSLPLSMILSWYEQKAVAVLLALLSLGIKNIYLGPILPAFLSPNVVQYLVDTFQLHLISNAEDDIKTCLKQEI